MNKLFQNRHEFWQYQIFENIGYWGEDHLWNFPYKDIADLYNFSQHMDNVVWEELLEKSPYSYHHRP